MVCTAVIRGQGKGNYKEIIVLFDEAKDASEIAMLADSLGGSVQVLKHVDDYVLFGVQGDKHVQGILDELNSTPSVRVAEINSEISTLKISNDAYADSQWAIHNPGKYVSYVNNAKKEIYVTEDIDMDVPEAWEYMNTEGLPKREVVVAVIDTGVDYNHPELSENMWININEIPGDMIDNDNNGYIDDINGWDFYNDDDSVCHYSYNNRLKAYLASPNDNDDHGTHIAGIIAASADNGIGIAGIASNIDVKIMALKINGGKKGTGEISNAIEAIKYATMMGADICNLSWGTSNYSAALEEVIKDSDMLFVAAAGNTGTNNNKNPIYPSSMELDNLISVTYINAFGKLARLSNYGDKTVDIAAPGDNILSTIVGDYSTMSGSSMAAPQVSALAALLYSCNEGLYPSNVKEMLLKSMKALPNLLGSIKYPGIPSAYRAVLSSGNLLQDVQPPTISLKTIYNSGIIEIPVEIDDKGGSGIRVARWIYGDRDLDYFRRGTVGNYVKNGLVIADKAGMYTFYVSDYAGNETAVAYEVIADTTPPKITVKITGKSVTVWINDKRGGVRRAKYLPGKREVWEFMPAGSGTEIKLKDNTATFKVKENGFYTIYAIDHFGNNTVKVIEVKNK